MEKLSKLVEHNIIGADSTIFYTKNGRSNVGTILKVIFPESGKGQINILCKVGEKVFSLAGGTEVTFWNDRVT